MENAEERSKKVTNNLGRRTEMEPDTMGAGRWVLVTGASGGIGYELSRRFAHDRFNVVLIARDAARLSTVARELEDRYHTKTLVLPKDLSHPAAAGEIYKELQKRNLGIEVLVNNAGFGDLGPFADAEWEVQRQMLQVNVTTLVELTCLFLPEMIRRGSGRVLNIGSTGSFAPVPYMAVYGASKAFVLSFTEALSAELEGTGVTATALCPGVTATQFAKRAKTEHSLLVRLNQMTAGDVARTGYRALVKNKPRVVPGWFNKLIIGSLRLSPRSANLKMSKMLMRP
jgi:short-subunit dehydrogenase